MFLMFLIPKSQVSSLGLWSLCVFNVFKSIKNIKNIKNTEAPESQIWDFVALELKTLNTLKTKASWGINVFNGLKSGILEPLCF